MKEKIAVAFSGGKDSVMLVHHLIDEGKYEIDTLFVTVTDDQKSTSHKVDEHLVRSQAKSLGIPLRVVQLSTFTREHFENALIDLITDLKKGGVDKIAYGDLYLEDVRVYKERLFRKHDAELIVPLWGRDTKDLVSSFIDLGYSAYIICVDKEQLSLSFLGEKVSYEMIRRLPEEVDFGGENGEYHTFVFDGPLFNDRISIKLSEESSDIDQRWYYKQIMYTTNDEA